MPFFPNLPTISNPSPSPHRKEGRREEERKMQRGRKFRATEEGQRRGGRRQPQNSTSFHTGVVVAVHTAALCLENSFQKTSLLKRYKSFLGAAVYENSHGHSKAIIVT